MDSLECFAFLPYYLFVSKLFIAYLNRGINQPLMTFLSRCIIAKSVAFSLVIWSVLMLSCSFFPPWRALQTLPGSAWTRPCWAVMASGGRRGSPWRCWPSQREDLPYRYGEPSTWRPTVRGKRHRAARVFMCMNKLDRMIFCRSKYR